MRWDQNSTWILLDCDLNQVNDWINTDLYTWNTRLEHSLWKITDFDYNLNREVVVQQHSLTTILSKPFKMNILLLTQFIIDFLLIKVLGNFLLNLHCLLYFHLELLFRSTWVEIIFNYCKINILVIKNYCFINLLKSIIRILIYNTLRFSSIIRYCSFFFFKLKILFLNNYK